MVLELVFPARNLSKVELKKLLRLRPWSLRFTGQYFLETISEAHCERVAVRGEDEENGTMRKSRQGRGDCSGRTRVESTWREENKSERGQRLIYWFGMTCRLWAVTGLSVTFGRISSSAFCSAPLNLRKPNREISGSPSKNKNKAVVQLVLPYMGGESKPQFRVSVSFSVVPPRSPFAVALPLPSNGMGTIRSKPRKRRESPVLRSIPIFGGNFECQI